MIDDEALQWRKQNNIIIYFVNGSGACFGRIRSSNNFGVEIVVVLSFFVSYEGAPLIGRKYTKDSSFSLAAW